MRFTVLFDGTYWIGLLEDERDGYLYAAKQIFGPEPSNEIVYEFIQHEWRGLCNRMTQGVPIEQATALKALNPKRQQREIRRELAQSGISTAAQEAMRLQSEQGKQEQQISNRELREQEKERKRAIAVAKAKAKRRGH